MTIRTRVLRVDGEYYLILARGPWGLFARALHEEEVDKVEQAFDDLHAELEARLRGADSEPMAP